MLENADDFTVYSMHQILPIDENTKAIFFGVCLIPIQCKSKDDYYISRRENFKNCLEADSANTRQNPSLTTLTGLLNKQCILSSHVIFQSYINCIYR